MFSDMALRNMLLDVDSVEEFKANMQRASQELADFTVKEQIVMKEANNSLGGSQLNVLQASEIDHGKHNGNITPNSDKWYHIGSGIKSDLSTRLPYYWSDFKDGIIGKNTISKTVSTTLFLYFRYGVQYPDKFHEMNFI